ncbi:hypothetical protein M3Y96_01249700 [Aphelenchoides besseyi]|nr:hypothetical protein M3Y96_01249700 [Aphelenchoides besseyi]
MDDDPMTDDDSSSPPSHQSQSFNIANVLSSASTGSMSQNLCNEDAEIHGQASAFDSRHSNYYEDEEIAMNKLESLYPLVDHMKTPLPRFWNPADKSKLLQLSCECLQVQYSAAAVRANSSIPRTCGIFYFEIYIVEKGETGYIGIGLSEKNVDINRLPGWESGSYGYHGDDGNFFAGSGKGGTYGPNFSTGDTIGCGINFMNRSIFFTRNGENLGVAAYNISIENSRYPTVGMRTPGAIIDTNFGQKPFAYKIEVDMKETETQTLKHIRNVVLPPEKSIWMAKTVSAWLANSGYSKTLSVFNNSTGICHRAALEELQERRQIMQLVVDRKISEAIQRTNSISKKVFEENKQLALLLMIQEFLELYASLKVPTQFANQPTVNMAGDVNMDEVSPSTDMLLYESEQQLEGEDNDINRDFLREAESVAINHLLHEAQQNSGVNDNMGHDVAATNGHAVQGHSSSSNGFTAPLVTNGNATQTNGTSTNIIAEVDDDFSSELSHSSMESDWEMDQSAPESQDAETILAEDQFTALISMGQRVSSFASQLKNAPPELLARMDDAFSIVCYDKPYESPKSYLLEPSFRKFLARALNSAIMATTCAENIQAPDVLFRRAKELRLRALKNGAAAPLRCLSLEYGADLAYTEEIIDQKLLACTRIQNGTVDYVIKDDIVLRIAMKEKEKCVLQIVSAIHRLFGCMYSGFLLTRTSCIDCKIRER